MKSKKPDHDGDIIVSKEFRRLYAFLEKAVRKRKLFCLCKGFSTAKNELEKRGWIEISCQKQFDRNSNETKFISSVMDYNLGVLERNCVSVLKFMMTKNHSLKEVFGKLVLNLYPNYLWCPHRNSIRWKQLRRDQIVNKFPRSTFTTKTGLMHILKNVHHFMPLSSITFYPRCYQFTDTSQRDAFLCDYKLTACIGLIRWFYEGFLDHGVDGVFVEESPVPIQVIKMALNFCQKTLSKMDAFVQISWDGFLDDYYAIAHRGFKLSRSSILDALKLENEVTTIQNDCVRVLKDWKSSMPQMVIDGIKNVWIVKPGQSSQGRGILIRMKLDDILQKYQQGSFTSHRVVQKYIERPLLIYDTKFDIRQWFVVTNWDPMTIWMYKSSYLRFCSQPYTFDSFHESIHLSNNAIQTKYLNGKRSKKLPTDNMWSSEAFQYFLKGHKIEDVWHSKIYPGMKKAIIATISASQQKMMFRMSCRAFELYGADFMLSQDFSPWLIEINSSPALGPSTSVTRKLCRSLLKDLIRLTTDKRVRSTRGKSAKTGNFECIFRQANINGQNPNLRRSSAPRVPNKVEKAGSIDEGPIRSQSAKPIQQESEILQLIDAFMSVPSTVNDDSKLKLAKKWLEKAVDPASNSTSMSAHRSDHRTRKKTKRSSSVVKKDLRREKWLEMVMAKESQLARNQQHHSRPADVELLRSIPVCTHERTLRKYGCNCVLKEFHGLNFD